MKRLFLGIATASSPKLHGDKIIQEGAIYSLFGNVVPESVRKSGLDGDSIINGNPNNLSFKKILKIFIECIVSRRVLINSYYLGPWFSNFGHFLIESITRIDSKIAKSENNLVFHTMDSSNLHQQIFKYQENFLSIVGINKSRVKVLVDSPFLMINTLIRTENAVFPRLLDPLALEIVNLIKASNKLSLNFGNKIYLSRMKMSLNHRRIPDNLSLKLEELFQEQGFKIIHPQELDIIDQISIVSKAQLLAGPQGSALHLSIFCETGTKIFEIEDEVQTIYPNTQQKIICDLLNQEFNFIPYDANKKTFDFEQIKYLIKS